MHNKKTRLIPDNDERILKIPNNQTIKIPNTCAIKKAVFQVGDMIM